MGEQIKVITGNVSDVLPLAGYDACLCDPPYGLSFIGKDWDHGVPSAQVWRKVYDSLKPGAMLMAFGGTRTHHRLMMAIEDAGFEIRDCLMWLYGSGFPKSHNLDGDFTGYGTALKPAWEPIVLAMKPCDGTFANNALSHGVAGLNIDGGRIETDDDLKGGAYAENPTERNNWLNRSRPGDANVFRRGGAGPFVAPSGRWPANLLLDEDSANLLGDTVSRFFYCAKAGRAERGEGNTHPTVKPLDLNRYLANLIKPPEPGKLLVPFCGSGSEMIGAWLAGWRAMTGIELNDEYAELARARIAHHLAQQRLEL